MNNEEAATRLEEMIPLSGGETPGAMENYYELIEALKMGAAALREVEGLREERDKLKLVCQELRDEFVHKIAYENNQSKYCESLLRLMDRLEGENAGI